MGEAGLAFRALLDSAGGFWVGSDILVYDLKEPLMDSLHGEGIEEVKRKVGRSVKGATTALLVRG